MPDLTDLRPRSVTLRVPDLTESLGFYRELLGLDVLEEVGRVDLSSGEGSPPLLTLVEASEAPSPPGRAAGLFHLALRVPHRRHLARVFIGLEGAGTRLQGASDHGVSEALYMADPHGNGVEIYSDRPREEWRWREGEVQMYTRALDLDDLLAELGGDASLGGETPLLPPGTDLGHVHLRVTELDRAERFYRGVLGLGVTTRSYPGALFFAAGDYHHHIGANVWGSAGGAPCPEGALGLARVSLATSDAGVLEQAAGRARAVGFEASVEKDAVTLRDSDGIRVRVERADPDPV